MALRGHVQNERAFLCVLSQQLVCVRLTEGLTGDMTVLGDVKHKLVCSPDFEALLKGVKAPSRIQPLLSTIQTG